MKKNQSPRHEQAASLGVNGRRREVLGLAAGALIVAALPARHALSAPGPNGMPAGEAAATRWASGGTQRIAANARFPNPFGASLEGACRLTCATTIGPCHTTSPERVDISDAWDGLPLRLALRVVDEACQPVPDAVVEIWHTNFTGGYSGQIVRMCNNDQNDVDKQFFRGYQRSDAQGVVAFNTCYPGWYRGRAVHIHVRVQRGDYAAADRAPSSLVTQLLFSDVLNAEVFAEHEVYRRFGAPDTTLEVDNVVGGEADKTPYLLEVQRMDDGVMFAHKTMVLRSSDSDALCQVQGARGMGRGPGPMGGPGGDRPMPPPDGGFRPR